MIKDWETKTLADVSDFVRGPFGGSLKKDIFVDSGYAVYEQMHAIYGDFKTFRYYIDEKKFHEMKRFLVKPGDLLMSCSGTMGKTSIVPKESKEGIINQALLKITPKKEIDVIFFKLWMDSRFFQDQLLENAGGAAIQNVASVKILKSLKISLPKLNEQQRIIKVLDEKFALIDKLKSLSEEQLSSAKELFESRLVNLFKKNEGWHESKLDSLCTKITDGSHNPPKGVEFSEYLMLSSKNVFNDNINLNAPRYLSEKDFKSENKRTEVMEGDVLLTIVGTIGRTAVVSSSNNYYTLQRSVAVLKPDKNIILPRFLMYVLRSIFDELVTNARGVAQKGLYLNQIRDLKVSVPDVPTQSRIIKELDELSVKTKQLENIFRRKTSELEKLKKSYLHEAFSGKL